MIYVSIGPDLFGDIGQTLLCRQKAKMLFFAWRILSRFGFGDRRKVFSLIRNSVPTEDVVTVAEEFWNDGTRKEKGR